MMPTSSGSKALRSSRRPLLYNWVSGFGLALFFLSTAFGLPLVLVDLFQPDPEPYLGSLIYLILPAVATFGVGIAVFGAFWERARRKRIPGLPEPQMPVIDLSSPAHQVMLLGGVFLGIVSLVLVSITGYQAHEFSESVQFCGLTCHQVMKPHYDAYLDSPHARVACVACHVGSGAGPFLQAKLNGLRQVAGVATGRYPKPIPAPVKNLRPSPETCEQCHWPSKFFGSQQKSFHHTLPDEGNSPWEIRMLTKVGGGDPRTGAPEGIHWHMNIRNPIEYAAADEQRQVIPWVRVTSEDGKVTNYVSQENPLTPEQLSKLSVRRMDCVDCHNRPAHVFHAPDRATEQAFHVGRLDRSLPYLRREAVRLLAAEYRTREEASAAIASGLTEFYRKEYPEVARSKSDLIAAAVKETQEIYARNFYPGMRTDWRAYPDQAGHLNSEGCFRCHDGLHKSADGRVITKDCTACHAILSQGPPEEAKAAGLKEQSFRHPVDAGVDVTEYKCSQCHNGAAGN